jgi:hypothetical protein
MKFSELNLEEGVLQALDAMRFEELGAYLIIAQYLRNITKKPSKNW